MTNRLQLTGHINGRVNDKLITYVAAAPADIRSSACGSVLPFENADQAFNNTPNTGKIQLGYNNSFTIDLLTPNSYFEYSNDLGKVLVQPCVFITYDNISVRVNLSYDQGKLKSQYQEIHNSERVSSDDSVSNSEDQWVIFQKSAQP